MTKSIIWVYDFFRVDRGSRGEGVGIYVRFVLNAGIDPSVQVGGILEYNCITVKYSNIKIKYAISTTVLS